MNINTKDALRLTLTFAAVVSLTACAGKRHFKTVRVEEPTTQPAANTNTPTTNPTPATNDQTYAANWDNNPTPDTTATTTTTTNDNSTSPLNARIFGDAPAAGINSDIDDNYSREPTPTPNRKDSRLSLFGEINGQAGLPGQFAALEATEQISFAGEGADFNPSIDITGEYLLYASTQHGQTSDIYQKSTSGKTVTRLTSDPADDMFPSYSPDNQHIAFSSNRAGNWDIYIMDAQGGRPVRLTDDQQEELHPSWSPDGRFIVYSRLSNSSGRWELWITEFANPVKKQFLAYGLFPSWCPDPAQNKIVYQQARERGSRLFSVWTIDIVNGEARRPTEIASANNAAAVNPAWSADGKMISFATIIDPDQQDPNNPDFADIWVTALDGNSRAPLTNGEYTNLEPCWGPEGKIYFISDRSGTDNVWSIWPDNIIKTARGGDRGDQGKRTQLAEVPTHAVNPNP